MRIVNGIFALILGCGIIGLWAMLLSTQNVPELDTTPVSIAFHLAAEFSMGVLMLTSGFALLFKTKWADGLFLVSCGLVIYAVINSAGYYGQQGDFAMVGMFMGILAATAVLSVLKIRQMAAAPKKGKRA